MLDLSSSNLYIASERLEASHSSKEARSKLIQASKDVLQGTMKVNLHILKDWNDTAVLTLSVTMVTILYFAIKNTEFHAENKVL